MPVNQTTLEMVDDVVERAISGTGCVRCGMPTEPEWQPIETAPRDGTLVLLYVGRFAVDGFYLLHWEPKAGAAGAWVDDSGRGLVGEPTHWMSLPEPPK